MANNSVCPVPLRISNGTAGSIAELEQYETSLLMLLGFGGVSVILALLYNAVRKYIFHDYNNLDTTFDAGGNVTTSLTAVTIASQMFWPGDLLQGATNISKLGIAVYFWVSVSILVNILIFPILSVHFKTRAPGAKTYLQIIHARFGKSAHITFCVFALLTNTVVMVTLLLSGRTAIQSLTKDVSDEYALLVMATLFCSYSLIGGIGTTFYISYFNTCLIFIFSIVFFVKIFHDNDSEFEYLRDISKIYQAISCVEGPPLNTQRSLLTFQSSVALVYAVIVFFGTSALTYCDQASWQSRIAAKPIQGVIGFILAGCMWFALATTTSLTTGFAYLAISAENGSHILNSAQINQGFVTPFVVHKILGPPGAYMVLTIISMALMSTGSGEVMAVSSILVYDIYQTYIKPFRKSLLPTQCKLCGKTNKKNKISPDEEESFCQCVSVTHCQQCLEDKLRNSKKLEPIMHFQYVCQVHGRYRQYEDYLIQFKSWCIVFVAMSIVPFGLIIFKIGLDLNWMFLVGAIFTVPSLPPVVLSTFWVKTTAAGVITGAVSGLLLGIATALSIAATYEEGLKNFLVNTSQDGSILAGSCISFGASLIGCVFVSMFTNRIKTHDDEEVEWQKLYDIDNPLNPWDLDYTQELKGLHYDTKPSFSQMASTFLRAKRVAYIFATCGILLFIAVIPGIMSAFSVLTESQFEIWIGMTQAWAVVMGTIAVFAPPLEEIAKTVKQQRKNQQGINAEMLHLQDTTRL